MTALAQQIRLASQPAPSKAAAGASGLAITLLREGMLGPEDLVGTLSAQSGQSERLLDQLLAKDCAAAPQLLQATARHYGVACADPSAPLPDPALIDALGTVECLRLGLVPWQRAGGLTIIATSRPEDFAKLQPWLQQKLGPVAMTVASAQAIETALHARRGARLALAAETRVALAESARGFGRSRGLVVVLMLTLLAALWPMVAALTLLALALLSLLLGTALKLAAAIAALRRPLREGPPPALARLPMVSIIVALYREDDIAARLIRRLSRLDYPHNLLEVLLAVEEHDRLTREALTKTALPPWMRVIVVPPGKVKTKPRALNLALDHCHGTIIGVYDAEDAPNPDQIRKIVERFHSRGPEVACLQGMLDFYNPRTNWLSRCFTLEYATWFRLVLPGVARLGLAVPLGGTTLFFRRSVLEELGGWDAYNVTEDADLGIRLARRGYRTELVETVTAEEANCRAVPWIKQRSRWIKGYMMTWVVHMRSPRQLFRELGPKAFTGFQVMFLGSVLQALLAPLMWSFWLLVLGLPHPVADALPSGIFHLMIAFFILSEVANIALALVALKRSGQTLAPLWVVSLHLYFMLAAVAAYKGFWEMLTRPFYWDKTLHGIFDPADLAK
ncbi:glycosyltransferase [Xinfangfangia sp. CPCC 101601]|uniref:Glycosyltransferase n=1 Tax=Pseudogemmobacter lacusdianii TaxID=3069608 RepID=A0ABU0VWH7_9RHOB|nr:glycosyltransferase family 2 protein [Xinfangfangia sp. CPCC 101601]MDQ2065863.1 glycosyltransferase [Xinfangfangia sp. CPCC 101601]